MIRSLALWLAAPMLAQAPVASAVSSAAELEVARAVEAFNQAVASNDIAGISSAITEDWRIIDGDGHIISRDTFLQVVASGALRHSELTTTDQSIRILGDTAIVTARARSVGTFQGAAFATDEISTDVLVRQDGRWRCVLTQLTKLRR